jgi:hypothetical protein
VPNIDNYSFPGCDTVSLVPRREASCTQMIETAGYSETLLYLYQITRNLSPENCILHQSSFCRALDYGRLGSILGHEITHGFDESGNNFFCLSAFNIFFLFFSSAHSL